MLFGLPYETGMGLIAKFIVKNRKIIHEYYIYLNVDPKIPTQKNNTTKAKYTFIIPAIMRLTQEDPKFQARRGDIVTHCLKNKQGQKMPQRFKALSEQT